MNKEKTDIDWIRLLTTAQGSNENRESGPPPKKENRERLTTSVVTIVYCCVLPSGIKTVDNDERTQRNDTLWSSKSAKNALLQRLIGRHSSTIPMNKEKTAQESRRA